MKGRKRFRVWLISLFLISFMVMTLIYEEIVTTEPTKYKLISFVHLNVICTNQTVNEIKDMTWEDIKELNGNELPPLRFYENGELKRINGKYTDMKVYTAEDAKTSIGYMKSITVIADRTGNTSCLNSSYMKDLSIVTEPNIDNKSIINIVFDQLGEGRIQDTRLVLFREDDESNKITLCWEVITKGELSL